ncbi:MAG: DUF3788 domain-containing protein [Dysgonamonadaceae bacterium]|jgi:hypothetical protein|nr:DUF3788 domain-containing protein [Dysgonamonadaceae bacterium]
METQLLRKQEIFPSKEVLKDVLGDVYAVFETLETQVTQDEFALTFDWHYYNDGKSWLCKVCHKKKTVFWLSVWDGFFQTGFFFLERHLEGIAALEIDENSFVMEKNVGKFIPLIFRIKSEKQILGLLKMVEFKKKAK